MENEATPARVRRFLTLAILVGATGLACSGNHQHYAACAASQFHVEVAVNLERVDVSLQNQGGACRFAGTDPVFIKSARHAEVPRAATGVVADNETFVQPFIADQGTTCPANLAGSYRLVVSIEGTTIVLADTRSRQLAPSIDACMVLTPRPAYVTSPKR